MKIAPGVLCLLVQCCDLSCLGRTVEVLSGPVKSPFPEEPEGEWYEITADWLVARHGDRQVFTLRHRLLPIAPDADLLQRGVEKRVPA